MFMIKVWYQIKTNSKLIRNSPRMSSLGWVLDKKSWKYFISKYISFHHIFDHTNIWWKGFILIQIFHKKEFFGMSSYIYHKNKNFILKKIVFHSILIIVTLSILKSNEFNHLSFLLVFNFLFNSENFINWVETFFVETKKFFFWLWKYINFTTTFLQTQRCLYISSNDLYAFWKW